MSSKFGPENTIDDVLKSSVWRGVSKTVEGRQAMVNDAFEDLTIETGTKIRLKVTGSAPGKLPRNTTPAIDSFLSDYRLVTPGIPGTCKITPTPPAPVIAATPAVAADASATVPAVVDLPSEDLHYVRGTEFRTMCNKGRGLVKYVDDAAKAGCTACRVAVGLEPFVRIHSATPTQAVVIGGSGIGWINGQKGPELHQHQGLPASLTFGAPSALSSGAAMAAATGPQPTNPLHHVDWTTPARPAFAVPPVAEQLEGLRVAAPGYGAAHPAHLKIRPMVIAFVGDGNNLDAKQMRHLVEHTKLPIPITFGRITIGSVVALEFTSTGPVRNVTADLELIGPWQQAPLRNKTLGIVKNDPQSPRLYALLIPSTEAADATATSAAAPPSPPALTLDLPPMSAHTSDEAIVLALGMPESEADTLRALAAEASAGMADFGVSLTLEQYIRGLLRTEARRTGLVAEKAKPNGALPALRPYPAPFPGPHTPSA